MTAQNYVVKAGPSGVTLLLAEVGAFRMSAEGAVVLAQQLLEAANEIRPGTVMKIGGWE